MKEFYYHRAALHDSARNVELLPAFSVKLIHRLGKKYVLRLEIRITFITTHSKRRCSFSVSE